MKARLAGKASFGARRCIIYEEIIIVIPKKTIFLQVAGGW